MMRLAVLLFALAVALARPASGEDKPACERSTQCGEVVVWVTLAEGRVTKVEVESERPRGEGLGAQVKRTIREWSFSTEYTGRYKITVHVPWKD